MTFFKKGNVSLSTIAKICKYDMPLVYFQIQIKNGYACVNIMQTII